MSLTISAGPAADRMADRTLANLEKIAAGSPIDAYLDAHPETKERFEQVGRSKRRPPMPSIQDMQQTDTQTFQTSLQTSQPGTVGNTQTSQTSQTSGVSTGKCGVSRRDDDIECSATRATDVEILAPEWLDIDGTKWLVRRGVTVLVGAKRSGKSTFSLYSGAKITRQGLNVLIAAQEDDPSIMKARLLAMHADMAHAFFFNKNRYVWRKIEGTDQRRRVRVNFDYRDVKAICDVAESVGAELLIVDPITALAKGDWNRQDSADCLAPLTSWAQDNNTAVLAIMHPGKNPRDVRTANTGSDQWLAKARSHLAIAAVPGEDNHSIIEQPDQSYGDTSNMLVTSRVMVMDDAQGKQFSVRYVSNMEPTERTVQEIYDMNAQQLAAPIDPDEKGEVAVWLHDTLHDMGNHAFTADVHAKAKNEKNWTPANLRAVYRSAGVAQTKQSCARPRSILYLTDLKDYAKADQAKGLSPEQLAKQWGDPSSSQKDDKSGKSAKSQ